MIKNIKRMAMLFVAAAALLNFSCTKPEPEPEPQIMNLVGTTWKFYYEGDVQGMELVMSDELQVISADSLLRIVHVSMGPQNMDRTATAHYTWDGTTWDAPDVKLTLTYRESDNTFFRVPDEDDAESAQIMALLGLTEFVYHKQ